MNAGAIVLVQLYLWLAALGGLFVVHQMVTARGAWLPLNRRFLFGLRVTILLFAGRVLLLLTGIAAFRILVLLAAALIPLAVLLLTEGLLRRHAPKAFKTVIAAGTLVFLIAAFWYGDRIDPARLYGLLAFQILGFGMSGYLVLTRDRASLGPQENRMVGRLGLSLILLVPMAAGDFLMLEMALPVQFSALAVLVLCWLAVSLGRPQLGHRATLGVLGIVFAASSLSALVIGQVAGLDRAGLVLVAAVLLATFLAFSLIVDARSAQHVEASLGLLQYLAASKAKDPLDFLRGLQDHPQVDAAIVVREDALTGLSPDVLTRIFRAAPVLQKSAPPALGQVADDHIAFLFDRFAATHILHVSDSPRLMIALSLPSLGTSPHAGLELQVVQRMAYLLAQQREGMADE